MVSGGLFTQLINFFDMNIQDTLFNLSCHYVTMIVLSQYQLIAFFQIRSTGKASFL